MSIFSQVKALVIRQIQLMLQDRPGRIFEWGSTVSLGFVAGSVFYDLPKTSEGAFTREGILFVSMLFNIFIGGFTILILIRIVLFKLWSLANNLTIQLLMNFPSRCWAGQSCGGRLLSVSIVLVHMQLPIVLPIFHFLYQRSLCSV